MKNNFRGWKTVYHFTLRQATKGLGFKLITILLSLIIIGLIIVVNVFAAKPEADTPNLISPIDSVYILDQSGLPPTDYKLLSPQLSEEQFNHINFINLDDISRDDAVQMAANNTQSIVVVITKKEADYELEAIIPEQSSVTKNQAEEVLTPLSEAFQTNKLMQSGLSMEQLSSAMKPVITSYSSIGEKTNEIAFVIQMIAPMIFGLMLYMMLLLYGQTISKSVSTEKTSKLMETILTSIHPYALISGKVLAITTMALFQFVIWIASAVVGLYAGNAIAHNLYPGYENSVITIINFLKDNIGETALSIPAIVLAVIFFCVGFLFYCVLASLAGCMVSKPEDVASTQALFQFPVIISWLVCYFAPITGNEQLLTIVRYIPFTAPFSVPVNLITGSMGLVEGVIALATMLLFTLLVIMLAGRLYKGLILYNGQKLNLQMLGKILKASK